MATIPVNMSLYRLLVKGGASDTDALEAATVDTSQLATKADLGLTTATLKTDIADLRGSLIQWMVGIVFTAMALQTALILALLSRIGR